VLQEQVDDGTSFGVIVRVQSELREQRVLPDQVGDRVLEDGDDSLEGLAIGRGLEVVDDVELDAQLTRRSESVLRGPSMTVVVDGDVGHRPEHYGYRARMRLLALRCGDIRTDPGLLLAGRASGHTFDLPVMTHAIDTGDGVLLWDTGMNVRCFEDLADYLGPAMASTFEPLGDADTLAPARLRRAGFDGDDIRWVVNSHLHFDHCGCNSSFPPAKWVIRAREAAFYRSKLGHPAFGLGPDDLGPDDPAPFDYEDEHDLLGDGSLVLLDTRGHTPGHQSLLVTFSDGRRYVLVGDAAYTRDAVDAGQPQGRPWNAELATAALARLKALEESGATLLLAHDREQWSDVSDVADVHAA